MKLYEIETLLEQATPGPWFFINSRSETFVCNATNLNFDFQYYIPNAGDAKFIADSRDLMPKLLAIAKAAKHTWLHHDVLCDDHIIVLALKELEK